MRRRLTGVWQRVFFWTAFAFAVFQLYTAGFGALPDIKQRAVHLIFGLTLGLLSYKNKRGGVPLWDVLLIVLVIVANVNIYFAYERVYLFPGDATTFDLILGALLSLLIVYLTQRLLGWAVPVLVGMVLAYVFFVGPYIPGEWGLRPLPLQHVISSLYYSNSGIYGMLTGLSATLIAAFVIFGALLLFAAGGKTFVELALKLTGHYRGGPAKVAVISSAMFGTVSGSAVANVLMTGNFTIPLMKRLGYPPHFAGAVEATSSTGGSITPPIMAAGAFILAEFLAIPYIKVVVYAIIPALLFYVCVFSAVHFEALRLGLSRVPEAEIPSWRSILTWPKLAPFLIPIALLLAMLIKGFSITYAGFGASVAVIVLYILSDLSPKGLKERTIQLGSIMSRGGQAMIELVPLLVCVGMLVDLFGLSGVLVKISGLVVDMGQTSFLGALFVAALVPLLLGMSIPPTGAYVLAAAVVAPALAKLGIDAVPANMFLFYFSCLAPITPPVCAGVFVAASLAEAKWIKVSLVAMRLGFVAFVIPFFFVVEPALLAIGSPLQIIAVTLAGAAGAVFISAGFFGYLLTRADMLSRLFYLVGGFSLLYPNGTAHIIGAVVCAVGLVLNFLLKGVTARVRKTAAYPKPDS